MENGNVQAGPRLAPDPPVLCASLLSNDWAASSIGAQSQWPLCVQTIIDFLMGSPFPMHVAWGPQLHTIYNDAYARLLNERHPAAFGTPLLTIWNDCAEHLSPLLQKVMTGESIQLENQVLHTRLQGREAGWLTSSHAPLRDSSGVPIGIWSTICETTPLARIATRNCARLELQDALRDISSFYEAIRIASDVLACQLEASRVVLLQWEATQSVIESRSTYATAGNLTLTGNYEASMFGTRFFTELNAGKTWIMHNDSNTEEAEEQSAANIFHSLAINTALAVPITRRGRLKYALLVISNSSRRWEKDDTAFARKIVDRTLLAVDEMQMRHATERNRKHLAQNIAALLEERKQFFDIADELLAVLDHKGRIVRTNHAWERILDYSPADLTGKDLRDFIPVGEHARFSESLLAFDNAQGDIAEKFQIIAKTGTLLNFEWKIRDARTARFLCGKPVAIESPQGAKLTQQNKFNPYPQQPGMPDSGNDLLKDVSVIVAVIDAVTNLLTYANNAFAALVGEPALVGQHIDRILLPAQAGRLGQAFAEVRESGRVAHQREMYVPSHSNVSQAGPEKYVDFEFHPMRGADGSIAAFIIVGHDATAEVVAINEMRIAGERWQIAVESKGSGVWERDLQTGSMRFSLQWLRMLGYATQDFEPTFENFQALLHPQDRSRVVRAVKACTTGAAARIVVEYRIRNRNGSYQWVESRGMVIGRDAHGNPTRLSGILTDISKKKQTAETQWIQANFDALTGLPNRRLFLNRLDNAVLKSARSGRFLALMFIDLDSFKNANDSFGHDAGDLILKEAAARISSCVRTCDTVARLGGDEFTVIMSDLRVHTHIEVAAQKIIDVVAMPFAVGENIVHLSASVGITLYSQDATSSSELISNADRAMYVAKSSGGNQFHFFTDELQIAAKHRMQIATDLRGALQNNEFTLAFQPVFKLATMEIVRAEVLLRWNHPRLGILEPADFLAVAQESHLIDAIDDWVFCQTAQLADRIKKETGAAFPFCVKKSLPRAQMQNQPFGWLEKMRELGLPPGSIAVEISEEFVRDSRPAVRSLLENYRNAGVDLVLDNFGAGSFSVAHIYQHKFRCLKVHLSQINDLTRSECNDAILASVLKMGDCLGVEIVICDIETDQHKETLQTIGYVYGQGFFLSRPLNEVTLLYRLSMP